MDISQKTWLYIGQALFGLVIGFMVGLSVSPVVSTIIGLMFAFVGGSIIVLIKGRSDDELEVTGKSITAMSLLMMLGLVAGIIFRANNLLTFVTDSQATVDSPSTLSTPLTLPDIKDLGSNKTYATLICTLINNDSDSQIQLDREQLKELIEKKVEPTIIFSLLGYKVDCQAQKLTSKKNPGTATIKSDTVLFTDIIPGATSGTDDTDPDDITMTH